MTRNPIPELAPLLKQLRLSGILDSLELRNRQAIDKKLAYTEFLALLIEDEVARRDQRKLALRLRRANFRSQKTVEQFDFSCAGSPVQPRHQSGTDPRVGYWAVYSRESGCTDCWSLRYW